MQKDSTDFNSIIFYTAETVKDIHLAGRSIGTFLNDVRGIFTIFNY
jgi:hypothetical protein